MVCAEAVYGLATRSLCVLVVGFSIVYGALGDADASELIYSPWERHCIGADMCLIGMDVRLASECKPVVAAAVLIERTGETKKTLRVTLPNVHVEDGIRVRIDGEQPVQRPFEKCYPNGCPAVYEAGAELVDQLKRGTMLVIEATSAAGVSMTYRLPLGEFATAYDGAAIPSREFEPEQKELQEELWRRQQGLPQPRGPENRKAGCETDGK
jgi:invasion protein IalB